MNSLFIINLYCLLIILMRFCVLIEVGKTSACYVDPTGKGISIGSTQFGPYYRGNSIILNYTSISINSLWCISLTCLLFVDGAICTNSVKWSTIIHFICSDKSLLIYDSTNSSLCIHVFQWKSRIACKHTVIINLIYNLIRKIKIKTVFIIVFVVWSK